LSEVVDEIALATDSVYEKVEAAVQVMLHGCIVRAVDFPHESLFELTMFSECLFFSLQLHFLLLIHVLILSLVHLSALGGFLLSEEFLLASVEVSLRNLVRLSLGLKKVLYVK
jgi:hypothetical protein